VSESVVPINLGKPVDYLIIVVRNRSNTPFSRLPKTVEKLPPSYLPLLSRGQIGATLMQGLEDIVATLDEA